MASSGIESLPALTVIAPSVEILAWMRRTAVFDRPVTSMALCASRKLTLSTPLLPFIVISAALYIGVKRAM
jgi:uncharacterized membrane protein